MCVSRCIFLANTFEPLAVYPDSRLRAVLESSLLLGLMPSTKSRVSAFVWFLSADASANMLPPAGDILTITALSEQQRRCMFDHVTDGDRQRARWRRQKRHVVVGMPIKTQLSTEGRCGIILLVLFYVVTVINSRTEPYFGSRYFYGIRCSIHSIVKCNSFGEYHLHGSSK